MTFEEAIKIKTRPKFGSKRHEIIHKGMKSHIAKCDWCGVILCNVQSIVLHTGRICEKQTKNQ